MSIKKILGLTAVAGLMAVAVPAGQAQAFSPANPAASSAKFASESMTSEVRWRRHYGHHRHYWRPRWHRRHRW
ncbi:MAG: hypothetical protein J0I29_05700 [Rhizobiales bacterium]|nr:hypothetical protein [Hyphomicrobiales bacterium]